MIIEDQIYTLAVENHDNAIWLCLNDNNTSIKIAQFISGDLAKAFTKAYDLSFAKGHAMGRMGI